VPETKQRSDKPVHVAYSFAEALTGVAALRDYTRVRRERNQGEDAILAYFYRELFSALKAAAEDDEDGFDEAQLLVTAPDWLAEEIRRSDDTP
jgi:hypothetical protein